MTNKAFTFEFSLEVLNHLGRGLYRSFATVIAEAISNSWDAEATKVKVNFDKTKSILTIEDNGKGMDDEDFQKKFLKIGYSRREDQKNKSKRNVIGRKGIGKLALLSVSDKITIVSKKEGSDSITGGIIDNKDLNEAIERNKTNQEYKLQGIKQNEQLSYNNGTKIVFENLKTSFNNEEIIRKYMAIQFNFIFSLTENDNFEIFVNGQKISQDDLQE